MGAGLCTRFFRVDNREISWYEVDFPEVIDLKHKLIGEGDRLHFIAGSILENTWLKEIQPLAPVLIIM